MARVSLPTRDCTPDLANFREVTITFPELRRIKTRVRQTLNPPISKTLSLINKKRNLRFTNDDFRIIPPIAHRKSKIVNYWTLYYICY